MKRIICFLLAFIIISLSIIHASAHTILQYKKIDEYTDLYGLLVVGSENIGWAVDEFHHIGQTSITYRFDSNVSNSMKSKFYSACSNWNTAVGATFTEITNTSTDVNLLIMKDTGGLLNNSQAAKTGCPSQTTRNTHPQSWVLIFSTNSSEVSIKTFTHEIGHVFGLADLYNNMNIGKLMYWSDARTVSTPQSNDIKGYKVINGLHTAHNWRYTNEHHRICKICGGISTVTHTYTWFDKNSSTHRGYCVHCQENVYQGHENYIVNNTCTRCGRVGNFSTTQEFPGDDE